MKEIKLTPIILELLKDIEKRPNEEPSKPLYIIAGNCDQARYFMRNRGLKPKDVCIVDSPRKLEGIPWEPNVVFYGTYYKRKDFQDLQYLCDAIKANVEFPKEEDFQDE